jgi:hypothetical protein
VKVEGKNGGDLRVLVLVLRLRRHLEKLPKRGYDTKRALTRDAARSAASCLTSV